MPANSRRLSILTAREIDDLYGLPRLTDEDRRLYFELSTAEREAVGAVRTASTAAHLVLQLGYFKAKRQFFVYDRDAVLDDLHHILQRHFPGKELATIKALSKPTRLEQQRIILQLFGYRACDSAAKEELERKAQRIAMRSTQPIYILREALQYLAHQRVVIPGYTYLQDMVGRVVTGERKRITQLLSHALTPAVEARLAALLQSDEGMYRISVLKHEPKNFS
jgi:exonuclease VII large subunit